MFLYKCVLESLQMTSNKIIATIFYNGKKQINFLNIQYNSNTKGQFLDLNKSLWLDI